MERLTLAQRLEAVLKVFPFSQVEQLPTGELIIHTGDYPSWNNLENALDLLEDLTLLEGE